MRMKCPKNKKCPKVNPDTLEYLDWKNNKNPLCEKCNNGKDKKEITMSNRYGVDTEYFNKELKTLAKSLGDRTPEELERYLKRLADVAKVTNKPKKIVSTRQKEELRSAVEFMFDDLPEDVLPRKKAIKQKQAFLAKIDSGIISTLEEAEEEIDLICRQSKS
jgi:hypothetical protein